MSNQAFVIERTFDVPVDRVWDALTQNEQLKKWYFQFAEFKPVVGFEFQFTGTSKEDTVYLHHCKITELVPGKKLAYSWRYDGYSGNSVVTFELFEDEGKTRLKLTHEGIETFAAAGADFAKENFAEGWTYFVDKSLRNFLETEMVQV
jgi:uncharacterized protein YndB with AHSA1/START domain